MLLHRTNTPTDLDIHDFFAPPRPQSKLSSALRLRKFDDDVELMVSPNDIKNRKKILKCQKEIIFNHYKEYFTNVQFTPLELCITFNTKKPIFWEKDYGLWENSMSRFEKYMRRFHKIVPWFCVYDHSATGRVHFHGYIWTGLGIDRTRLNDIDNWLTRNIGRTEIKMIKKREEYFDYCFYQFDPDARKHDVYVGELNDLRYRNSGNYLLPPIDINIHHPATRTASRADEPFYLRTPSPE